MNKLSIFLEESFGLTAETQSKILISIFIVMLLSVSRLLILRVMWRQTDNVKIRYFWKKILSVLFPTLGIIFIGSVWINAFREVGAFLGLLSAGIAIALKDLLANIAGWFFLLFRKPFQTGDRIQIGPHCGDVIDIRIFQFTILEIGNWVAADQSTGRIIHIPNGKVFTEPQANYSSGFKYIWNEIEVLVTFESDWMRAKSILLEIGRKHAEHLSKTAEHEVKEASKKFFIHYQHLTPAIYTRKSENGIMLTLRYLCDPRKRRGTEHAIWEDILLQFEKNKDIRFAYPTQRFVYSSAPNLLGT